MIEFAIPTLYCGIQERLNNVEALIVPGQMAELVMAPG